MIKEETYMNKYQEMYYRYYDKNGVEITDNCTIRIHDKELKVVATSDGRLGTDATNPHWIETGRAVPFEYGVYALTNEETNECEVIK